MAEPTLLNPASERAVLAGICKYGNEVWAEVSGLIEEETFTVPINKVLYSCLKNIAETKQSVDFSTILSSAQSLSLGEIVNTKDNIKHINGVLNTPVNIDNVRPHAQKIRRLQFARQIQTRLREIFISLNSVTGDESITSILAKAEQPIQELCLEYSREDEHNPVLLGTNIDEYIKHINANHGKSLGIPSPYPSYNKAIGGGFRRKCVDLIAARPKVGKSCIADNIALHIAGTLGIPVLMLDTEMSTEDHWNRILANLSGVSINEIANGNFLKHPELSDKVLGAAEKIKSIPYHYISIAGKPFEDTLSIARRWLLKNVGYDENGRLNDCLIVYDYLKLMTSESISSNLAEFQVLGFQITSLHNFCVENDCACLSFVQLNRDGITKESTDAVSGSDRLIWLCTSFTIFKEKGEEEIQSDGITKGNRKLVPIVARHGPGMDDDGYICLKMTGDLAKIEEIGTIRKIKRDENRRSKGVPDRESQSGDDDED